MWQTKNHARCCTGRRQRIRTRSWLRQDVMCRRQQTRLREDAAVDLIIGNNRKADLVPLLDAWFAGKADRKSPSRTLRDSNEYEKLHIKKQARTHPCVHQSPGRMQPVLQLLHHPVHERPRQKPPAGGRGGGSKDPGGGRLQGNCPHRHPSDFLRHRLQG